MPIKLLKEITSLYIINNIKEWFLLVKKFVFGAGYFDKKYYCNHCVEERQKPEIDQRNWRCPDCKKKLLISIHDDQIVLRLLPSEMKKSYSIRNYHDGTYIKPFSIHHNKERKQYTINLNKRGFSWVSESQLLDCKWEGQDRFL